jgi:hypothetical protein
MPEPTSSFEKITRLAQTDGTPEILDYLEQKFRTEKEFFQLFEVLKMRCRHRLGLPLTYGDVPDDLDEASQRRLEDGLLEACGEVGTLLVEDGELDAGWMYLQPLNDRGYVEKVIRSIPIHEENLDRLIEITVSQGAAPAYGYRLLMNHYGTCNAITTFDTQALRFDRSTQKSMAEELLRHVYGELCSNLISMVERQNETVSDSSQLSAILAEHPWLVEDGAHHIDATHLASVVRIARVVDQRDDLERALELCGYGVSLHPDFQYASPIPFEATYPDHQQFFSGLLGTNVEAAIQHFQKKCETIDSQQHGSVAWETLVDFLVRLGKNRQAIEILTTEVLGKFEPLGIAPQIFQIAQSPNELVIAREFFRTQDDLLGFAVSILKS